LELAKGQFSRWAKTNIESNEFYEENKDWWGFDIVLNGNECRDYRLTTDFAKHLSMESHSAKGKSARDYFVKVEDKLKETVINRSSLSPELQMFMQMGEAMANQELEQKRQAKEQERQALEGKGEPENDSTGAWRGYSGEFPAMGKPVFIGYSGE